MFADEKWCPELDLGICGDLASTEEMGCNLRIGIPLEEVASGELLEGTNEVGDYEL